MKFRSILTLLAVFLVVSGFYYFSQVPEPVEKPETQLYVWDFKMDDLQHITISLPKEGKSQSFIKEADRTWHFDDSQRSSVNMTRWGGGIPLLLSGPGVDRVIAQDATEEVLAQYGLTQPQMEIILTLANGEALYIKVGDKTPNSQNFYVQAPDAADVATVDISWFDVMSRLVTEPPYA